METKPNEKKYLHYGSIIFLQLGEDESHAELLTTEGYIVKNVFTQKFQEKNKSDLDFYSSLFLVFPTTDHEIQKQILNIIRNMEFQTLHSQKPEQLSKSLGELIEGLEYEVRMSIERFHKYKGMFLGFGQSFQLLHMRSSRYLSYIVNSSQILNSELYSFTLEDTPSEKSIFAVQPCIKYQTEVFKFMPFDQFVILGCNIGAKEGYMYINKENSEGGNMNLNYVQVSFEKKTQIRFRLYTEYYSDSFKFLNYGDVILLILDQINQQLEFKDDSLDGIRNVLILNMLSQIGPEGGSGDSPRLLDHAPKFDRNRKRLAKQDAKEYMQQLTFTRNDDNSQYKNTQGLWKIEGSDFRKGGKVNWSDNFRLRNVRNGKYLTFDKESNVLCLEENVKSPEMSEFQLEQIGEKDDRSVVLDTCFFIKHATTGYYFCADYPSKENEADFIDQILEPRLSSKIKLSDAFRFTKAKLTEVWEINFILAGIPILRHGYTVLSNISNRKVEDNQNILSRNEEAALFILKDSIMEINNFCYDDNDQSLEMMTNNTEKKTRNPHSFRQKILRDQGFINLLSNVLIQIDQCIKRIFGFIQNSNKKHLPLSQKILRKAKRNSPSINYPLVLTFDKLINNPTMIQKITRSYDDQKNSELKIMLLVISELTYGLLRNICKNNEINQQECFRHLPIFKEHLGMGIGSEQCIISILDNNERLLYKLHTENVNRETVNTSNKKYTVLMNFQTFKKIEQKQDQNINTLVHSFIQKYHQKHADDNALQYNVELLQFFNSITHSPKNHLGITMNQLLIIDTLNLESAADINGSHKKKNNLLIEILRKELVDQKLFIKLSDAYEIEEEEYELNEAFEKIRNHQLQPKENFENYFQQELILYGNLCYGRNYCSKKIVRQIFQCGTLLKYIKKSDNSILPNNIRASLVYILLHAHLDSKPRIEQVYPVITHSMVSRQRSSAPGEEIPSSTKKNIIKLQQKTALNSFLKSKKLALLKSPLSHEKLEEEIELQSFESPTKSVSPGNIRQNMVEDFSDDDADSIKINDMEEIRKFVTHYISDEGEVTLKLNILKRFTSKRTIKKKQILIS